LLGKSGEELRALLASWGQPAYRGAQIYHAMYAERRFEFAEMTNLPAALRERLAAEAAITLPRIARRYVSRDGSIRYLLEIETPASEDAGYTAGSQAGQPQGLEPPLSEPSLSELKLRPPAQVPFRLEPGLQAERRSEEDQPQGLKPHLSEASLSELKLRPPGPLALEPGSQAESRREEDQPQGLESPLSEPSLSELKLRPPDPSRLRASKLRPYAAETRAASVEAVFMPEETRQTICISTQAGCAVDCHFCLTAQLGLIRNLTAGEIVGQVLVALEENRGQLAPQTNVVLMGQGEPLLNYEAVMEAVRRLLDANGVGLSPKRVTLSTSGIVPGIERLGQEKVRPKLAVSLNASTNEQRDAIMPINRKYPLEKLLEACRRYPLRPWERLTFEYVLLGGLNDSAEDARRVAKLAANIRSKVNLIPWNPGELPYRPPDEQRIEEFRKILTEKGLPTFVRYSRGQDIMAACGQLALLEVAPASAPVIPSEARECR